MTVVAVAAPSRDPATNECTVTIGMVNTIAVGDAAVVALTDPTFEFGGSGSGVDVCGVLKASDKDPADQGAIAQSTQPGGGMS